MINYVDFEFNNKKYSFLNHLILNEQIDKDTYFSISVHDNKVLSINAKKLNKNEFINIDNFKDIHLAGNVLDKFFKEEVDVNTFYSNLYNSNLYKLQMKETIENENLNIYSLVIDESLYLLTETEFNEYQFVKKVNNQIISIDNEDEFLHILMYFFPIILYKGLKEILFDGFDLKIIEIKKDMYAIFNGNDNFYILREEESKLENNKFVFRYVENKELSKKDKKEIQKLIKKERI